jgi:hypothetical protein
MSSEEVECRISAESTSPISPSSESDSYRFAFCVFASLISDRHLSEAISHPTNVLVCMQRSKGLVVYNELNNKRSKGLVVTAGYVKALIAFTILPCAHIVNFAAIKSDGKIHDSTPLGGSHFADCSRAESFS